MTEQEQKGSKSYVLCFREPEMMVNWRPYFLTDTETRNLATDGEATGEAMSYKTLLRPFFLIQPIFMPKPSHY